MVEHKLETLAKKEKETLLKEGFSRGPGKI